MRRATRASPMAAPNHVPCPCRRTRLPHMPGSLQRSPPPGPGPPLSQSPRGTQHCLLRRYCRCRCCFLPTPQSHTRDDSAGVRVAMAATVLRGAAGGIHRRRRSSAARAAPLWPFRPSVRFTRQDALVRGHHGVCRRQQQRRRPATINCRKRVESGAAMPCSWCAIAVVGGGRRRRGGILSHHCYLRRAYLEIAYILAERAFCICSRSV